MNTTPWLPGLKKDGPIFQRRNWLAVALENFICGLWLSIFCSALALISIGHYILTALTALYSTIICVGVQSEASISKSHLTLASTDTNLEIFLVPQKQQVSQLSDFMRRSCTAIPDQHADGLAKKGKRDGMDW
jgi:hypothetical protein